MAALVLLVTVSGCMSAQFGQAAGVRSYSGRLLKFTYPRAWLITRPIAFLGGMNGGPIVFVSNFRLAHQCQTFADGSKSCMYPSDRLPPRGVLVTWGAVTGGAVSSSQGVFPGKRGRPSIVDGRPARIRAGMSGYLGDCRSNGAEGAVNVVIRADGGRVGITFLGCYRGPNSGRARSEIEDLLNSATFSSPLR